MLLGKPWSLTIPLINTWAVSAADGVPIMGRKLAIFDRRSTTIAENFCGSMKIPSVEIVRPQNWLLFKLSFLRLGVQAVTSQSI